MNRSNCQHNTRKRIGNPQMIQAPKTSSANDKTRTVSMNEFAVPSSMSSSETPESEPRTMWSKYKGFTSDELVKNKIDSSKLTFQFHRIERGIIENGRTRATINPLKRISCHSVRDYSNTSCSASNIKLPKPAPRHKIPSKNVDAKNISVGKSIKFHNNESLLSIYAPKSAKHTIEARQKRNKSILSRQLDLSKQSTDKHDKPEDKSKVSFIDYAKLRDRIEKLEKLLQRQNSDISVDWKDVTRRKIEGGNSSRLEDLQHPFPNPAVFAHRVGRLHITSEILQFYVLYCIITILGVILSVMTALWIQEYNGGFYDMINLHILLSMIGFLFLTTQGILVFRTIKYVTKGKSTEKYSKGTIAHSVILLVSLLISSTAMVMAFVSRGATIRPSKNLYSLHAWVGVATFAFFCLLWMSSLLFFFPRMIPSIFRIFLPTHVTLGMTSFFLIVSSCLSGFMEEVMWSLGDAYEELPPGGVLVNCIGVLIIIYCGFVIYITQTVKDI